MRQSNMVVERVRELHAVLATVVAKRAMVNAEIGEIDKADKLIAVVERWLTKAGARATDRRFSLPSAR